MEPQKEELAKAGAAIGNVDATIEEHAKITGEDAPSHTQPRRNAIEMKEMQGRKIRDAAAITYTDDMDARMASLEDMVRMMIIVML